MESLSFSLSLSCLFPWLVRRLTKGLRSRGVEMKAVRRSESVICLSIHFPRLAAHAYMRPLVTPCRNAASNFVQCIPDRLALVCKSPEKSRSNYSPDRMPLFIKTLSGFRMSCARPPNNGSIPRRCLPIRSDTSHLQAEIVFRTVAVWPDSLKGIILILQKNSILFFVCLNWHLIW